MLRSSACRIVTPLCDADGRFGRVLDSTFEVVGDSGNDRGSRRVSDVLLSRPSQSQASDEGDQEEDSKICYASHESEEKRGANDAVTRNDEGKEVRGKSRRSARKKKADEATLSLMGDANEPPAKSPRLVSFKRRVSTSKYKVAVIK